MQIRAIEREPRSRSQQQRDARTRRLHADPTIVEHGSDSTYRNWGCRCPACKFAHSIAWYQQGGRNGPIERHKRRMIGLLI